MVSLGDVIVAPDTFIIPMRPSKNKYVSNGSSKGTRSKSRKYARKHTKLKSCAGQQQIEISGDSMECDDSSSNEICNGIESPAVNGNIEFPSDSNSNFASKTEDDTKCEESNNQLDAVASS